MIDLKSIPKYVINLDGRKDRLEHIQSEYEYLGWEFIRYSAVNTGSYEGCALSHIAIAEEAYNNGHEYVWVTEDDVFFMPYFKELLSNCLNDLSSKEWDLFHFAPSIHRPMYYDSGYLVDLSCEKPPKEEKHRGIYGTSGFIYKTKMFSEFKKWHGCKKWPNPATQKPFDVFFDEYIYENNQCYCPHYPLVTQIADYSTINRGVWNNHYIITYNWKAYIDKTLPQKYLDINECRKDRK
jgi:GR25 family glycosyltransferase involved in LPS biosynthesis